MKWVVALQLIMFSLILDAAATHLHTHVILHIRIYTHEGVWRSFKGLAYIVLMQAMQVWFSLGSFLSIISCPPKWFYQTNKKHANRCYAWDCCNAVMIKRNLGVTFWTAEKDEAGKSDLNAIVILVNKTKEWYPQMKVNEKVCMSTSDKDKLNWRQYTEN